jgi:hypothetical protein
MVKENVYSGPINGKIVLTCCQCGQPIQSLTEPNFGHRQCTIPASKEEPDIIQFEVSIIAPVKTIELESLTFQTESEIE